MIRCQIKCVMLTALSDTRQWRGLLSSQPHGQDHRRRRRKLRANRWRMKVAKLLTDDILRQMLRTFDFVK